MESKVPKVLFIRYFSTIASFAIGGVDLVVTPKDITSLSPN